MGSDLIDGRFEIGERLGAGAMGVVFRARDRLRGDDVAIKMLKESEPVEVARFDREVDLLVALQHPGIVRYVAHGRLPTGAPWLAMQCLVGETLKDRIDRGKLGVREILDVGMALASALVGAHAQGVIHRDVKPANVFLVGGSTASVKLLDFGVARLRPKGKSLVQLTETGFVIGTPAYMSPEQARGDAEISPASDVCSLGVVLFRLLAGELPFEADDLLEVLFKLTTERAPSVALYAVDAPPALAQLVDAMLAPTPAERPSMVDVFNRLGAARADEAPQASELRVPMVPARRTAVDGLGPMPGPPPSTVAAARKRAPLWPIAAVAAVAAAIAIIVGVSVSTSGTKASSRSTSVPRSGSAEATSTAPLPPVASSSPRTEERTCSIGEWCLPKPFSDPASVDPDAFIDLCVSNAERLYPGAVLRSIQAPWMRSGRLDVHADPAKCVLSTPQHDGLIVQLTATEISLVRQAGAASEGASGGRHCSVATAWSAVQRDFGAESVDFAYAACPGLTSCYTFNSDTRADVVDAERCTVVTPDRPGPAIPNPTAI